MKFKSGARERESRDEIKSGRESRDEITAYGLYTVYTPSSYNTYPE